MKLLLNIGHAHASTTSLFYTLGINQQYCHAGSQKENSYLWQTYLESKDTIKHMKMAFAHYKISSKRNNIDLWKKLKHTENIRKTFGHIFKRPFTIENYCSYYKNVYDIVKDDYESVGDFSTALSGISEEFLWKIKPILLKYFDVKITMTFRDPIRRFWSHYGDINADITSHDKYAENYQKYSNVFGKENVHYIIVEDLWSGETSKISKFLNYDIRHLAENVYWPLGDTIRKTEWLKDQWVNEKILTNKTISDIRKKLDPLYLQYERIIGRLPERWIV